MPQSNPAPRSEESQATKPVEKFHEGSVHVSIFENTGAKGSFRTASFQLRYKPKDSEEWKTSHSYGVSDLKSLERAAQEARTRIETWQHANKADQAKPAA